MGVINRQHTRGAPITRVIPELRGDAIVIDQPLPRTRLPGAMPLSRFGLD